VYLVPGVGQVALLVTGAVVVGATTYHIATSDDPTCVKIRESFAARTASFVAWGDDAARNTGAEGFDRVKLLVQSWRIEREYNDAKDKGLPTKNNHDETGHAMKPDWNAPHSSQRLFHDDTDKKNDCPKQIRYYDKDGKAELDIDFYGPKEEIGFPHRHTWTHGVRSKDHIYDGIEKVIENWNCKDYDFKNHMFKKNSDL
jgi:hypothetical protein